MSQEQFQPEPANEEPENLEDTNNGFDLRAGQSWIYPTNYAQRDYQFNIIQEALFKNTLLSLPTGLGKTFIAAVVMYNFYRWYPNGKIIFMAPTRPLVKQQIDACYNIMAIPQETTAELTGTKLQASRADIWQTKRVFFVTPQVLQNDLDNFPDLGSKIRCLVFDEAHKAKGNHAYCEVIRKLAPQNQSFRVLALSATPGSSVKDVLEVIENLQIAHLEFRSEESDDVKPYVFNRSLETVVVPLGDKLMEIKNEYVQILEKYTRNLIKYGVIQGNCGSLTKGKIFMVMKEFQSKHSGNRMQNYNEILRDLNICVTLYHAYEVLVRHGLRGFLNFYQDHINKPLLRGNTAIIKLMEDCQNYLGPSPNLEPLPDGSYSEIPPDTKFGHPKYYQLRDILVEHFTQQNDTDSRVIVFFEYRESVMEAYGLLLQSRPTIKPRIFLGQGSGITQKVQINVVKAFREGKCNTLLSTCIGEEGLDVGEVNLIVCFDVSNKSPIRMIQRMGRTGRKKDGRVVILVTEGKEQQTLKDCLIYKNNLGTYVLSSPQLLGGMYKNNPRMVPDNIQPKCEKIFITVKKIGNSSKFNRNSSFVDDVEVIEIQNRLPECYQMHLKGNNENLANENMIDFSKSLEKQRGFHGGNIKPSKDGQILVQLLQFADAKRFNIPTTQSTNQSNKNLKQGDIRAMFFKPQKPAEPTLTQGLTETAQILEKTELSKLFPPALFLELSTYLALESDHECKTCKILQCPKCPLKIEPINLNNFNIPDLSVLDSITKDNLNNFANTLNPKSIIYEEFESNQDFDNMDFEEIDNIIEMEHVKEESFAFEAPKSFKSVVGSLNLSTPCVDLKKIEFIQEELSEKIETDAVKSPNLVESHSDFKEKRELSIFEAPQSFNNVVEILSSPELNLDSKKIKVIEESPEKTVEISKSNIKINCLDQKQTKIVAKSPKKLDINSILKFFLLKSIEELFPVDLDATISYSPQINCNYPTSPDLFDQSPDPFASPTENPPTPKSESPILSTLQRSQSLKAKRQLFESKNSTTIDKNNVNNNTQSSSTKSDLDINSICDLSSFGIDNDISEKKQTDFDITEFCDLESFGICGGEKTVANKNLPEKTTVNLDIEDICDISGLFGNAIKEISKNNNLQLSKNLKTPTTSKQLVTSVAKERIENSPKQQKSSKYFQNSFSTPSSSQKENKTPPQTKSTSKLKQLMQLKSGPSSSTPTNRKFRNFSDSDDEFESSPIFSKLSEKKTTKIDNNRKTSGKLKEKKKRCDFLDEEAVLSDCDTIIVSDDENEGENDDEYEKSFVADETHVPNTQMQVEYLKSVKSPNWGGKFKIPNRPKNDVSFVFSQEVDEGDDTYGEDSFCVNTQMVNDETRQHDLSELEILELKLKEQRKNKRKQKEEVLKKGKRRRIVVLSDTESD